MKFTYCLQAMQLLVPFALLVFATGSESCGVHLVQRQIPPGPNNFYSIQATIKDNNNQVIGGIGDTQANVPIDVSSKLPKRVVVTAALPGSH